MADSCCLPWDQELYLQLQLAPGSLQANYDGDRTEAICQGSGYLLI